MALSCVTSLKVKWAGRRASLLGGCGYGQSACFSVGRVWGDMESHKEGQAWALGAFRQHSKQAGRPRPSAGAGGRCLGARPLGAGRWPWWPWPVTRWPTYPLAYLPQQRGRPVTDGLAYLPTYLPVYCVRESTSDISYPTAVNISHTWCARS
jgi:hypothetical protein